MGLPFVASMSGSFKLWQNNHQGIGKQFYNLETWNCPYFSCLRLRLPFYSLWKLHMMFTLSTFPLELFLLGGGKQCWTKKNPMQPPAHPPHSILFAENKHDILQSQSFPWTMEKVNSTPSALWFFFSFKLPLELPWISIIQVSHTNLVQAAFDDSSIHLIYLYPVLG